MVAQSSSQNSRDVDDEALEQAIVQVVRSAGAHLQLIHIVDRARSVLHRPPSEAPGASSRHNAPSFGDDVQAAVRRLEDRGLLVPVTNSSWKLAPNAAVPERAPLTQAARHKEPEGLSDTAARVYELLQRKGQTILYGPPGTGKTYSANQAAQQLAAWSWHGCSHEEATSRQLDTTGAVETCVFHPGYGYEDFIEGYRPCHANGQLGFELRPGIFKRLCARARSHDERDYFLLIDEINRGDVPRILGELLNALEKDKREKGVTLPVSGEPFAVPSNVYLIGTMNTADRSIALLDVALRRRFGFIEILPDPRLLDYEVEGLHLGNWLTRLNSQIVKHVGRDARHLQVGHSFLMPRGKPLQSLKEFVGVLRDEIVPLLEEYCYEDIALLGKILGAGVIADGRIKPDVLAPDNPKALVAALFSELTRAKDPVSSD
jgi:5-methylcytosine-specific restriction enzyme B